MPILWGASGEAGESVGDVRGLSVGAQDGHTASGGADEIRRRRGVAGAALQPAEGAMGERKGESADPDGGVILVAVVVFAALAFVLGAFVGFSAAAVLR